MVLIILRHGESEWNKLNKFTGLIDIELSDGGKQEAISAGEILRGCRFDHIFSSNLARTIQTAEIIARVQNNNAAITQIPDFRERDYGDLTGKNKTELAEEFGSTQVTTWRRSFRESPPNGENLEQVTKRVGDAYQTHVQPLVSTGKNVLIVAHGNSLRALFVHLGIKNPVTIEKFEIGTAVPIQIDPVNLKFRYENAYELSSYQIIDSRGYPSLEVQCVDRRTKCVMGKGSTPSGASCGSTEVCELRDGDKDLFHGKSVFGAVDKITELNEHFVGTPSIIVHPGGYSLEELSSEDIQLMKNTLHDSVKQLDTKNIHLLLENMPPYGWFYGGRWNSNIFLDSSDLLDYCKNTKNKSIVILNGIKTETFIRNKKSRLKIRHELKIPEDGYVIGHVARMVAWKGQDLLLKAFLNYAIQNSNAYLLLVGTPLFDNDHYYNSIIKIIESNSLVHRVIMPGYRDDLEAMYSAMDLFLYPSLEKDTSPLALLSAISSGLPVGLSKITSLTEIIDKCNDIDIFNPKKLNEISGLMKKYENDEIRQKSGMLNRESGIKYFDISIHGQKFQRIIKQNRIGI